MKTPAITRHLLLAAALAAASGATAATVTWTGAADGSWDTITGNWSGGAPTSNLYNNTTPDSVLFDDSGLNTTLSLAAGLTPSSVLVDVSTNNYTFRANGFGGTGSLTKQGTGTLTLLAANSYSGGTMLTGGTLSFVSGALGTTGAITMNGGTLQWNGTNTQDVSSRIAMVNATNATVDTNGNNVSFASAIGGSTSGSLTKTGAGTLTLSGANSYTGGTIVNGGVLALSKSGISATGVVRGALTINSGAEVQLTGAGGAQWALGYSGTDSVTTININGGTLNQVLVNGGGTAATINMTGGLIKGNALDLYTASGGFTFNTLAAAATASVTANLSLRAASGVTTFTVADGAAASDLTIGGILTTGSATQSIIKAGAGTMTLSGANTYNGATTVNAGTLILSGANTGAGTATVTAGSLVLMNSLALQNATFGGGAGSLVFDSSVASHAFTLGGLSGSSNLALLDNAGTPNAVTLTVGAVTSSYSGVLSGTGSLVKDGAGTLTLSGLNTHTGGTVVNGGTLTLTGGGSTGTLRGVLTINAGATANANGWALGYDNNYVDVITINGGTLNKTASAGTNAHTINMTGGSITGTAVDFYNIAAKSAQDIAFNTNASATTATVSAGMNLRMNNGATTGGTMTFTVADGAAATDLLISGNITVAGTASTQRLIKAGDGTMKITGSNAAAGGFSLTGGTLDAGSATALGAGTVTVSGGTLATSVAGVTGITGLTLNNASSVLNLNGTAAGTITLSANANLAMSAGTWNIDLANGTDVIAGSGTGKFTISGGTLDLGGGAINYGTTYNLLSGFTTATSSVTGLTIDGYDKTNWLASLGTDGALTFATAVPEPSEYGLIGAGTLAAVAFVRRRRKLAGKAA